MKTLQGPIQEALLALLCFDAGRGAEVAALLAPTDFDPVYRDVAELAYDYRNRHKKPPGEHTADLFDTLKERDEELSDALDRLLGSIEQTIKDLNPDYVIERAAKFARYQGIKAGLASALRKLQLDTDEGLLGAEVALTKALQKTAPAMPKGVEVFDDVVGTLKFLDADDESFATGIKELDRHHLGPARKKMHMLLAPYGKGKSWWLIQLAHEARRRGQNVLYVSLEMSEQDVCQRMVQRALGIPKRRVKDISWQKFILGDDVRDNGIRTKEVAVPFDYALTDDGIEGRLRKDIKDVAGQGRCLVFEFPTGRLSPTDLENHMTLLADRRKFVPDLVLVDYANIMRKDASLEPWDGFIRVGEELRAIAQTWNVGMATVGQVTSEGLKAKKIGGEHAGGARGAIGTLDFGVSYNQTDQEKELGLARLVQIKARQESDGFTVLISQNYAIGRFCCDSVLMGSNYMGSLNA